jgi:hypothetical protein
MVINGTVLAGSFTLSFVIHGKPRDWHLSVKTPGGQESECDTQEVTPYPLFDEMLSAAFVASKLERQQKARR